MVGVAQLVELRVVASVVVGSSPITHPILNRKGCGHLTVVFFFYKTKLLFIFSN